MSSGPRVPFARVNAGARLVFEPRAVAPFARRATGQAGTGQPKLHGNAHGANGPPPPFVALHATLAVSESRCFTWRRGEHRHSGRRPFARAAQGKLVHARRWCTRRHGRPHPPSLLRRQHGTFRGGCPPHPVWAAAERAEVATRAPRSCGSAAPDSSWHSWARETAGGAVASSMGCPELAEGGRRRSAACCRSPVQRPEPKRPGAASIRIAPRAQAGGHGGAPVSEHRAEARCTRRAAGQAGSRLLAVRSGAQGASGRPAPDVALHAALAVSESNCYAWHVEGRRCHKRCPVGHIAQHELAYAIAQQP
mmetsp:Transcript_77824/g.241751  ORF Transcript_77824/g.241751 Transcript_77824/m.241751 type:complete len:308 (+) Transcript_77824:489-1412(+)